MRDEVCESAHVEVVGGAPGAGVAFATAPVSSASSPASAAASAPAATTFVAVGSAVMSVVSSVMRTAATSAEWEAGTEGVVMGTWWWWGGGILVLGVRRRKRRFGMMRWWRSVVLLRRARPAVLGRWTVKFARFGIVGVGEWVVGVGAVEAGDEFPEGILLVEEAD